MLITPKGVPTQNELRLIKVHVSNVHFHSDSTTCIIVPLAKIIFVFLQSRVHIL